MRNEDGLFDASGSDEAEAGRRAGHRVAGETEDRVSDTYDQFADWTLDGLAHPTTRATA